MRGALLCHLFVVPWKLPCSRTCLDNFQVRRMSSWSNLTAVLTQTALLAGYWSSSALGSAKLARWSGLACARCQQSRRKSGAPKAVRQGNACAPDCAGHAKEDTFVNKHHSERLFAAHAGDKNFITFDGDHNSGTYMQGALPRPMNAPITRLKQS